MIFSILFYVFDVVLLCFHFFIIVYYYHKNEVLYNNKEGKITLNIIHVKTKTRKK
jgi:hypothetical protein